MGKKKTCNLIVTRFSFTCQSINDVRQIVCKQDSDFNINLQTIKFLLPRQGSNLDSSDPESDVLPITPRGKNACKSNKVYLLFK